MAQSFDIDVSIGPSIYEGTYQYVWYFCATKLTFKKSSEPKNHFLPLIQHGNIQFSPWIFYGKCWVFQTSLLGELGLFGVFDGHGGSAVRETQSKIMDIEYLPLNFFVITFTKIVLGSPQKKTNMKT